jgi:hypothetical protein
MRAQLYVVTIIPKRDTYSYVQSYDFDIKGDHGNEPLQGGWTLLTQHIAMTLTPCATGVCWVNGIRPPQPDQIDTDGTQFFCDFF